MRTSVVERILLWLFAIVMLVLIAIIVSISVNHSNMMKQCVADGHKEYQCYSMLRDRGR
jgi:cell division protein FtsL